MRSKFDLTRVLWIVLLFIIAAMVVFVMRRWLFFPVVIALLLTAATLPFFFWLSKAERRQRASGYDAEATDIEKRKRDRIDAVLRELSDDELYTLRRRLKEGEVNYDALYRELLGRELLGEEGDQLLNER